MHAIVAERRATLAAPELSECHWRYFFAKYSKSSWVGLGGMARIGTLFGVSVGIVGKSVSNSGHCVSSFLSVYLGGENWTGTLFSFNLQASPTFPGLRPIVLGRVLRRNPLRLNAVKRLTSVVRRICLSWSVRAVLAMSVESNQLIIRPDVSNHLPFSFQIHFEN